MAEVKNKCIHFSYFIEYEYIQDLNFSTEQYMGLSSEQVDK